MGALNQVVAVAWAQARTMRNHLPRIGLARILISGLSLLWYGLYAGLATALAVGLPSVQLPALLDWAPVAFLGIFLFWQVVPLFTLSSGWSLELKKLQIYPVTPRALFGIEVLLRLTSAPEMVIVLIGASIGLLRHPHTPLLGGFAPILFIPLNLFLSLAVRELILHSFERNRFRELFAVLLISLAVLPQILFRTTFGERSAPYFLAVARYWLGPWQQVSRLSLEPFSLFPLSLLVAWSTLFYFLASWQFRRSLLAEDAFPGLILTQPSDTGRFRLQRIIDWPAQFFRDPAAALMEKELRTLVRTPRFRVAFGMACVFSVLIFIPMTLQSGHRHNNPFVTHNFLTVVSLYGLLLLSDVLIFNVFGLDRAASQLYLVTPISLKTVLLVKNLVAGIFVLAQILTVLVFASIIHRSASVFDTVTAIASSLVVALFFVDMGNLSSVMMPRPIDPAQTFRRQAGGKMQLWFLGASLSMFLLVGFALLAGWALATNWAIVAVLVLEFSIGLIVYRISLHSATERAMRDRERILDELSKNAAPISSS
jgi:ABC-2 type transport system permease protein